MVFDVHGEPIDPVWAAEFRGFFLGEGSIEITDILHHITTKRGDRSYTYDQHQLRSRLRLIQRDDNRTILEEIQQRLGGSIYRHASYRAVSGGNGKVYQNRPSVVWQVMGGADIQRVIALLKGGFLTHSKIAEIAIMEEFLRIRPKSGHKMDAETRERCWALKVQLQRAHDYRESI